jgi:predicted metal-dependent hydrolase
MRGSFTYGERVVPYSAQFSDRRTLSIAVLPDGAVEVVAPIGTPEHEIESRLKRRARWIARQQRYFLQFRPRTPERRFVSGETHLYLGRQYRLKCTTGCDEQVFLKGGFLCVTVERRAGPGRVRELVTAWYRSRARLKLRERFDATRPKFDRFIATAPELLLRSMKTRWGSHTPTGRIILNYDLVRAPSPCIDYVVAHELAHVAHPNHGAAFARLLDAVLPDWRSRKERLECLLA